MDYLIIPLLYLVSYAAVAVLLLVAAGLFGFVVFRALKWLGKLVRAVTPD